MRTTLLTVPLTMPLVCAAALLGAAPPTRTAPDRATTNVTGDDGTARSMASASTASDNAVRPGPETIGVTHIAGTYHLTDQNYLEEGAEQILTLGSRVIKLSLSIPPERRYRFHCDWPEVDTLVELADSRYFRAVFDKPFRTYLLTVYSTGRTDHYWTRGTDERQCREEEQQFYDLARHLLTTYHGTGKTFILQHWEGDWAIRGCFDREVDPTPKAVRGMIDWLSARQAGVEKARQELASSDVRVYHAAEVNLVAIAMDEGRPCVTTHVLPHAGVDLVSYSAWDTQRDPAKLRAALDFIARHMPDRQPFGDRNVFVGEFGLPENEHDEEVVRQTIGQTAAKALEWGSPWVVYWQVYCNEARQTPVRANDDVRGFWLIRPDGSRAPAWDVLHRLIHDNAISERSAPRSPSAPH